MKRIIFCILCIQCLLCVQALNITAGETFQVSLSEPYSYYIIDGNSSPIDFNITPLGNIVNITFSKYSIPDSFSLTFYNSRDEVISSGGGSSGGSSGIIYKSNIMPTFNYTDCDENSSICKGTELWTCSNGTWKFDTLCYNCSNESCSYTPNVTTAEESINLLFWTIFIFVVGAIVMVLWVIKEWKKAKENKLKSH